MLLYYYYYSVSISLSIFVVYLPSVFISMGDIDFCLQKRLVCEHFLFHNARILNLSHIQHRHTDHNALKVVLSYFLEI